MLWAAANPCIGSDWDGLWGEVPGPCETEAGAYWFVDGFVPLMTAGLANSHGAKKSVKFTAAFTNQSGCAIRRKQATGCFSVWCTRWVVTQNHLERLHQGFLEKGALPSKPSTDDLDEEQNKTLEEYIGCSVRFDWKKHSLMDDQQKNCCVECRSAWLWNKNTRGKGRKILNLEVVVFANLAKRWKTGT